MVLEQEEEGLLSTNNIPYKVLSVAYFQDIWALSMNASRCAIPNPGEDPT